MLTICGKGKPSSAVGVIPELEPGTVDRLRELVGRHPMVRRVRSVRGPNNVVTLGSATFLIFHDRIYRSTDGGMSFTPLITPVDGLHGPAPVHSVAVNPENRVFYGEYAAGQRPQTVRVVRGPADGMEWKLCHTFAPGEVFHVHSVSYDPWADRLLVTTGDLDEESGVWELFVRFTWVEEEHWWERASARALLPSSDGSSPYLFVVPDATEDGFVTYRYRFEEDPGG